jgi:hypothetical protein
MKTKILLLSLLFSGATFLASAQNNANVGNRAERRAFNREQMQARADSMRTVRTAFIAEKAGLTAAEQENFLPLYQEYRAKVREARQTSRQAMREARQNKADIDYAQALNDAANFKTREAELLKEYTAKLTKVAPAEKVWKVFQMNQFKQNKMNRGGKFSHNKFGRGNNKMNCPQFQNCMKK